MDLAVHEPMVNQELAAQLGLLPEEFLKICDILGRTPNFTELSIFSVMWSEHCSYKNSIRWLKTLPREGKSLLAKAGEENAGLVDIGGGLACAFKIESHNHPSAIEPYQGAATGVGGIHRDIFTMGARPIAALNSLRFGNLSNPRTRYILKGVVKGIGDYGNCFGVPTVGGEIYFNSCYDHNPLVNAMSVGLVETGKTIRAIAYGEGNPVFIVGSATGKDGIHGATFASEDISEDSSEKLPAVQVGDPFQEKLLLEASLELAETDCIIGMQDMGAAGITCSTSEMSAKGECGMDIWLDKVPLRQKNMKPFEILLSESQERMLVVVKKGREKEVQTIFEKWDLNCVQIGVVTNSSQLRYFVGQDLVAEVPAEELVLGGGAPVYEREYREPAYLAENQGFSIEQIKEPASMRDVALSMTASLNLCSRKWVFEQYDSMVGVNTITTNRPCDAAILRIKGSDQLLAMTTDCNSRYIWANPEKGAEIAVSEAARNIVCSGGIPLAITNCLNFGNPYNPEVYFQFVHAIKGMGNACRKFETPVTGGNVSFYNQSTDGGPVFPTPTIGMIGLIDHPNLVTTMDFKNAGDLIYLIGTPEDDINSSEYLVFIHGIEKSPCPTFDLEEEFKVQEILKIAIRDKQINSAHDVSEGGLFFALLESAFQSKELGFEISTPGNFRKDAILFGESQSRIVVSVSPVRRASFEALLNKEAVSFHQIGKVISQNIMVNNEDWGSVADFKKINESALEQALNQK